MACTQTRISYNACSVGTATFFVVACTQTRISYNIDDMDKRLRELWLALRRGSVTITLAAGIVVPQLWLALRRGSVTIDHVWVSVDGCCGLHSDADQLQSKTIETRTWPSCGLHSDADQLQFRKLSPCHKESCGLHSDADQLQSKNVRKITMKSCGLHSDAYQLQYHERSNLLRFVVACTQTRISYNNGG